MRNNVNKKLLTVNYGTVILRIPTTVEGLVANKDSDPLYRAFLEEKARLWREERIRLTEKDFLDTIDPTRNHPVDSAKRYIDNLRTGKWRSNTVRARAVDTTESAGLYNVMYADSSGKVVSSANVQVPLNRSLLDAYTSGDLQAASNTYIERRYADQAHMSQAEKKLKGIESEFRKNTRGLKIVGIKKLERSYKTVEIIRKRKK